MNHVRRGFTLLEVVIGVTIIGVVVAAYMAFQAKVSKTIRIVGDQATLSRVLIAIEKNIMPDMIFIPPQQNDPAPAVGRPAQDSTAFDNPAVAGTRCYDKTGAELTGATPCSNFGLVNAAPRFRVRFFKVRVRDESLAAGSPLDRIPMSRVRFRVEYLADNQRFMFQGALDPAPPGPPDLPPLYFSRLKTEALVY